MKLKRWWMQSKKSFRCFVRTKDIDHIKDIWRLTKYYLKKMNVRINPVGGGEVDSKRN